MSYLEEAAELIRKVMASDESRHSASHLTLQEARYRSVRAFAMLAAIEKGLLPHEVAKNLTEWMLP